MSFADSDAKIMAFNVLRVGRMIYPFVIIGVNIGQSTKRLYINNILSPLVNQGALGTGKRNGFGVRLQKVLADFRPNHFKEKTKMSQDWIVTPYRLLGLEIIRGA